MGVDQRTRTATPSFIARTASWGKPKLYLMRGIIRMDR